MLDCIYSDTGGIRAAFSTRKSHLCILFPERSRPRSRRRARAHFFRDIHHVDAFRSRIDYPIQILGRGDAAFGTPRAEVPNLLQKATSHRRRRWWMWQDSLSRSHEDENFRCIRWHLEISSYNAMVSYALAVYVDDVSDAPLFLLDFLFLFFLFLFLFFLFFFVFLLFFSWNIY